MTLEFNSSVVSITVPVTIVDDDTLENTETFSALLTSGDSSVLLDPDVATVTINDNDSEIYTSYLSACIIMLPAFIEIKPFLLRCWYHN